MDAFIGFVGLGKGPRNIKYFAGETYSSKICSDLRVCWSALAYSLPIHVPSILSIYVYLSIYVRRCLPMSILVYQCLSLSMSVYLCLCLFSYVYLCLFMSIILYLYIHLRPSMSIYVYASPSIRPSNNLNYPAEDYKIVLLI